MNFLVCYVPSEELLAAAYEARPTLFYDAARDGVRLAGPATLLSILWASRMVCSRIPAPGIGSRSANRPPNFTAASAHLSPTRRSSATP
jgi:RmuC family